MRYLFWLALAALLGPTLTGCATISRGTNDTLVVDTIPPGARITTDRQTGKTEDGQPIFAGCLATPCEMRIPRRSEFLMTIEREGYEPVEIGVSSALQSEALRANLATTGKSSAALGAGAFVALSSAGGLFSTGAAAGAGAATAGIVLVPAFLTSAAVDGATGALLSLTPNPIVIELPPEGTEAPKHPKALAIREKRLQAAQKAGS